MSERGSWVTQFMYRPEGERSLIKHVLDEAGLQPVSLRDDHAILAGYYRVMPGSSGEELWDFKFEVVPRLAPILSTPLRIAVLCDSGDSAVLKVWPNGNVQVVGKPTDAMLDDGPP